MAKMMVEIDLLLYCVRVLAGFEAYLPDHDSPSEAPPPTHTHTHTPIPLHQQTHTNTPLSFGFTLFCSSKFFSVLSSLGV